MHLWTAALYHISTKLKQTLLSVMRPPILQGLLAEVSAETVPLKSAGLAMVPHLNVSASVFVSEKRLDELYHSHVTIHYL